MMLRDRASCQPVPPARDTLEHALTDQPCELLAVHANTCGIRRRQKWAAARFPKDPFASRHGDHV
jgi:hypothetical protein